jgi:hypothetical protein
MTIELGVLSAEHVPRSHGSRGDLARPASARSPEEQNYLQRVTDLAWHMVTQNGMSERLRAAMFGTPCQAGFLSAAEIPQRAEYSEETSKLLSEAQARVLRTLTGQRPTLDAPAQSLVNVKVIWRGALVEHLRRTGAPPEPEQDPSRVRLAQAPTATPDRTAVNRASRDRPYAVLQGGARAGVSVV